MKDIFALRARTEFVELLTNLLLSLEQHFPECVSTAEWRTRVVTSTAAHSVEVDSWLSATNAPLVKGSAKYAKAITSILGKPATVSHAIAYHDMQAVAVSTDHFKGFDAKLKALAPEDAVLFWQYMTELTNSAYKAARADRPKVPSAAEIADDIARRRKKDWMPTATVHNSVSDMWKRLHEMRGTACAAADADDTVAQRLYELTTERVEGRGSIQELCNTRDEIAFERLCQAFPSLRTNEPFNDEQWTLLNKVISLSTMHGTIPGSVMRGIEDAANQLVNNAKDGKPVLDERNLMNIGSQVLSKMSVQEIRDMTNNLPTLLPAIKNIM